MAKDAGQQVLETTHSQRTYTNGLETTDYLLHVARGRLESYRMGRHKFLENYNEKRSIKRRPGWDRPAKMAAADKALAEWQMTGTKKQEQWWHGAEQQNMDECK